MEDVRRGAGTYEETNTYTLSITKPEGKKEVEGRIILKLILKKYDTFASFLSSRSGYTFMGGGGILYT
jgi:hypothetical protein